MISVFFKRNPSNIFFSIKGLAYFIISLIIIYLFIYLSYYLTYESVSLWVTEHEQLLALAPAKLYSNADIYKELAIKENRGKPGVYRWTNIINGKSYIGSTTDLNRRFREYYNFNYLNLPKYKGMLIIKALLKYGYSNFSLEILEYCDKEKIREREQYYLDLIKPKYNVLTTAGASDGYKHSEEALLKIRNHLSKLNSKKGIIVEVTDINTYEVTVYSSIRKAAEGLNSDNKSLLYNEKTGKPFKGKYDIKILRK